MIFMMNGRLDYRRIRLPNSASQVLTGTVYVPPDGLRKKTFKPLTVRLLLVAEEYRNRGIGTFLLKNTIELALRDSCDAVFYTATSQSGNGSQFIRLK